VTLVDARAETRLPAQDLERARRWYADKLDLQPTEERPGALRYDTASGVFCLVLSTGTSRGEFSQLAFTVDDLRATVSRLRQRGVDFHEYRLPGLTTVDGIAEIAGNYPSKGTGELGAWFQDSEGNLLGLGQPLP
jgi:catechol 2,3-dioxygenase-like lactoylglutathione lyase family enzyme